MNGEAYLISRLVYIDRGGRQREVILPPNQAAMVIGRHPHCDLVTADASVSRRHCEIRRISGGHVVRDLGSANGTFLNDEPVDHQALNSRDIIRCGSLVLQFLTEDDSFADADALGAEPSEPRQPSDGGRHPTDKEALKGYVLHLEDSVRAHQNTIEELQRQLSEAQEALRGAQRQQMTAESELQALKTRISSEIAQATPPGERAQAGQPHPLLMTTLDLDNAHGRSRPQAPALTDDILPVMIGEFDDWLESLEALEKRIRAHRASYGAGSAIHQLLETLTAELFAHRLAVGSRKSAFLIKAEAMLHGEDTEG